MKLLIVDDSRVVRRTISGHVDRELITEVLEAGDGVEALAVFQRTRPDFVTMDITLPGMDGLTCVSEMMAIAPETRLMVISALGDDETAIEAVERGANEYVFKPFTPAQLNGALRNLLNVG